MKKILLVLPLTLLLLTACGNSDTAESSEISSLKAENSSLKAELKKANAPVVNKEKKTLNTVGSCQYTVTGVKQEKVKNDSDNYTNAEYNFAGMDDFPKTYYRAKISYTLKNVGDKEFDLGYGEDTITDAKGIQYTDGAGDLAGFNDVATDVVKPDTLISGSFFLLSKEKMDLSHFKVNVDEKIMVADNGDQDVVSQAGTAEY